MTKVRHETVHYTAAEMAAKEAIERVAKAKRRKYTLIIGGVVTLACIGSCLACLFMGNSTPDKLVGPTRAAVSTVEPTLFPTPAYLTVAAFEQERSALTDIQKEQYDQDILGKNIQFCGQVVDVYEDGSISIDEGGFFTTVKLLGIPKNVAITLQKGQLIEGMGTVADVDTLLILVLEIQVTSWNN